MKHSCCDSTVAPITMIISEVGRPISQLQQNRFSSLFHTQIACKTLETYLSALASGPQELGYLSPETGVRGAIQEHKVRCYGKGQDTTA